MLLRFAFLAGALAASACSTVPRSGPLTHEIVAAPETAAAIEFELVETDDRVVALLVAREAEAELARLAAGRPATGQGILAGDRVQVTLFEATGGGLFGAGDGTDGGGGYRELPAQSVGADGRIRVPYAGAVRVAGLSPSAAAARIEGALVGQAIEPQAIVSVLASPGRFVTVLGDAVNAGGRIPLSGTGERVLDMVAAAGGLSKPIHESALRLTRAEDTASVALARLLEEPEQNVHVRAKDLIAVEHRPRHFTVLGAVTQNARLAFAESRLTVDEALGLARGLFDDKADPRGVFVIRYEPKSFVATLPGVRASRATAYAGAEVPTVYRLDFSKPSGLILAKNFAMADRDLLYVATAEFTSLEKLLRVVSSALQPVQTAALLVNVGTN
ncbi:MAG: polysaccharide biosynthesis/export family protein [Paracoccaceae bacterium]